MQRCKHYTLEGLQHFMGEYGWKLLNSFLCVHRSRSVCLFEKQAPVEA